MYCAEPTVKLANQMRFNVILMGITGSADRSKEAHTEGKFFC